MRKRDPQSSWSAPLLPQLVVPAVGISMLLCFVVLYLRYPDTYLVAMTMMMKVPGPRPFVDWEWLPSAVRCWSEGVDVYVNNTCYKVWPNLSYNYSPLWLRATFLTYAEGWNNAIGLALGGLFFLSLGSLPSRPSWRYQVFALFAALSCGVFLAVERGNADLLLFLLIVAALNLRRLPLWFRLCGYGLIVLAGLLKFYPFVALAVVLRERAPVVAAVAAASAMALLAMVLAFHTELGWVAHNLPVPSYYTLQFGAADLPHGLGAAAAKILAKGLSMPAETARIAGDMVARALLPLFAITAVAGAILLARRAGFSRALSRLSPRETDGLIVGAAIIGACFFVGQSVIYRCIFLLPALPGLAGLCRGTPEGRGRDMLERTCVAIIVVLWAPLLENCLFLNGWAPYLRYQGDPYDTFPGVSAGFVFWLCSELAWWWIVTVLLAVLAAVVVRSDVWALAVRLLHLPRRWVAASGDTAGLPG